MIGGRGCTRADFTESSGSDAWIWAARDSYPLMSTAPGKETQPSQHAGAPAFPAFYDARLERTVRQVALMVGSVAVAEDIAHDAMVQVFERWDRIDDPGAYLYRCASNGALRWLGQRSRRRALDDDAGSPRLTVVPDIEFVEMAEALARLSDRQRVAVVLRYYEDLSEAQIAAALDCRVGSVGPLLTRARAALREELAP